MIVSAICQVRNESYGLVSSCELLPSLLQVRGSFHPCRNAGRLARPGGGCSGDDLSTRLIESLCLPVCPWPMSNAGSGTESLFGRKKAGRPNKGPARQKMPAVEKGRCALFLKGHGAGLGQAGGRTVGLPQGTPPRGALTSRKSRRQCVPIYTKDYGVPPLPESSLFLQYLPSGKPKRTESVTWDAQNTSR